MVIMIVSKMVDVNHSEKKKENTRAHTHYAVWAHKYFQHGIKRYHQAQGHGFNSSLQMHSAT